MAIAYSDHPICTNVFTLSITSDSLGKDLISLSCENQLFAYQYGIF
jgi:hypothetical protein